MSRERVIMQKAPLQVALGAATLAAVIAILALGPRDRSARADAPPGRYTAGADGATGWVKDNRTGLVWKKAAEPGTFTWAAAKTQCASPWRLPTVAELMSLVDDTRGSAPAIDGTFFPGTEAKDFWSSSPYAFDATKARNVSFDTGADYNASVDALGRVRCVR